MGFGFSIHLHDERLRLVWWSAAFVVFGGLIALGAAALAGYGWFGGSMGTEQTTNLSPQEAERLARVYGEQQLKLVQEASKAESRLPGGVPTSPRQPDRIGAEASALVKVDSRFLSAAGGGQTAAKQDGAGAWLFVFRAEGIHVAEWRTREAALEIQVVLSDASGRMLQTGVTLLPREPDKAAAIR